MDTGKVQLSISRSIAGIIGVVSLLLPLFAFGEARTLESLRSTIEAEHPGVPWVATETLSRWLAQQERQVVLLDIREVAEFDVSHLRDARRVAPDASDMAALRIPRSATIVVYCSVGYRSAALGQRLRAAGYQRVYNLQGGIFQWANEGRPVYRGAARVELVHPYDRDWGRLLLERHRSPL